MKNEAKALAPGARRRAAFLLSALFMLSAIAATASESTTSASRASTADVAERIARLTGKVALVDRRTPPDLWTGELRLSSATYPILLTILRNNGLAAIGNDESISIVPVEVVRQYALPAGNDAWAEEWVTRVIVLDHVSATTLVPIMRPLMPVAGHLAVHPEANAVVIADRHANAERIERLMRHLDAAAAQNTDD